MLDGNLPSDRSVKERENQKHLDGHGWWCPLTREIKYQRTCRGVENEAANLLRKQTEWHTSSKEKQRYMGEWLGVTVWRTVGNDSLVRGVHFSSVVGRNKRPYAELAHFHHIVQLGHWDAGDSLTFDTRQLGKDYPVDWIRISDERRIYQAQAMVAGRVYHIPLWWNMLLPHRTTSWVAPIKYFPIWVPGNSILNTLCSIKPRHSFNGGLTSRFTKALSIWRLEVIDTRPVLIAHDIRYRQRKRYPKGQTKGPDT